MRKIVLDFSLKRYEAAYKKHIDLEGYLGSQHLPRCFLEDIINHELISTESICLLSICKSLLLLL